MNTLAKILVPVTLAFGAFSAHAAAPINNEIGAVDFTPPAVHARSDVKAQSAGTAQYILQDNQTGFVPNPAFKAQNVRTRDEVRREARQPQKPFIGYFA